MKIYPLVRAEVARLTASRIGIASLIALMTVPVVYGGLYLWGNQDPYSGLNRVPAALVVQDTGTTVNGKAVDYGMNAAASLMKGKQFDWVRVSAATAAAGVKQGKYDFELDFPADFSRTLASATGNHPVSAALKLTTDDTNSYLSTTIAKQAAEAVRVEIAKEVGATASNTLLTNINSIRGGLVSAATGAASVASGAASAASGASSLASGSASVASGAASLSAGLAQIDSRTSALPSATASLAVGAGALSSSLATAAGQSSALQGATAQAAALAPSAAQQTQIANAFTAAGVDPTVSGPILAQLRALSPVTAGIAGTVSSTVVPGLSAASAGAARLSAGAAALNAQTPGLKSAVHSAAAGASQLSIGAGQTSSGASDLSNGVGQLASGSSTLSSSLSDAVTQIPQTTATQRKTASNLLANPLQVNQTAITEAQNYGAGLAPFFLSLASWIGIYALFLIVRPLSRRALTAVRRPIRTTLAGWLTPALLGVVQMVALFAIVTLALRLNVANPLGLIGFMAFVAVTFAAIVLALNVVLGSVGQFLALVFMVVQLVTAGGTFPWQTLPAPLAALHWLLPMSHAVEGIRQLMYGGLSVAVWNAIVPLLLWLVGSLLVATLGARRQVRFRLLRELRPSPIGA
ncbi:MAG: putative rane protein [Microbacteriaceae bacterium]|nr:putative rane protein [Microbacteriaceae bacterium]